MHAQAILFTSIANARHVAYFRYLCNDLALLPGIHKCTSFWFTSSKICMSFCLLTVLIYILIYFRYMLTTFRLTLGTYVQSKYWLHRKMENNGVPTQTVIFVTVFPYGYRKNTFQEHCNSYCQGTLISYSTFYKFFAVYIFRKPSGYFMYRRHLFLHIVWYPCTDGIRPCTERFFVRFQIGLLDSLGIERGS